MPTGVTSIEKREDGFTVNLTHGRSFMLTAADIPANIASKPIAEVQAWVNDWLVQHGYFARCKIRSVTPQLDVDVVISDQAINHDPFSIPKPQIFGNE